MCYTLPKRSAEPSPSKGGTNNRDSSGHHSAVQHTKMASTTASFNGQLVEAISLLAFCELHRTIDCSLSYSIPKTRRERQGGGLPPGEVRLVKKSFLSYSEGRKHLRGDEARLMPCADSFYHPVPKGSAVRSFFCFSRISCFPGLLWESGTRLASITSTRESENQDE